MPYLWFAIGYIGFFLLDALLNDEPDDDDDGDEGGQPPHRPPPAIGGDSAPAPIEELNLDAGR